jgi:hypothetical protein
VSDWACCESLRVLYVMLVETWVTVQSLKESEIQSMTYLMLVNIKLGYPHNGISLVGVPSCTSAL